MKKTNTMGNSRTKRKTSAVLIVLFVLLAVYVLGLFVPVLWSVVSSFAEVNAYYDFYVDNVVGTRMKYTFDNFINAWKYLEITAPSSGITYNVLGLYLNSVLYSLGCALVFTLCPCMVAYATARFKFRFSKVVYAFVIITMSLPIVGSMPSEIRMLKQLNIFGTFGSMYVLRFNFLSVYYLILFAQFEVIPMTYTEAAKIDGADNATVMFRIIVPQALNTIVTVFVLSFITYWNDFQIPLLYLPDYPTAAYCIYYFVNVSQGGNVTGDVPVQLAGTIIMTLPIIIVYAVFNKKLRVSVAMGGIKG